MWPGARNKIRKQRRAKKEGTAEKKGEKKSGPEIDTRGKRKKIPPYFEGSFRRAQTAF